MSSTSTKTFWNTPSGKPARENSPSSATAHCGTLGECLSRKTLPASTVGTAERMACQNGKFHGMIPSTAPRGWYSTQQCVPVDSKRSGARCAAPCSA